MNYKDFEMPEVTNLAPFQSGTMTGGIIFGLALMVLSIIALVVVLVKFRKTLTPKILLASSSLLVTALIGVVVFTVSAVTPQPVPELQSKTEAVQNNYNTLFSEHGFSTPKDVSKLRLGEVVETSLKGNPSQKVVVKIIALDGKVTLVNPAGMKEFPKL